MKKHLDAWYAEVEKGAWKDPAELKAKFRSASIVSSERIVFNIRGNDYRLVVAVNYHYQILLIVWLGTHKEYDKIDVTVASACIRVSWRLHRSIQKSEPRLAESQVPPVPMACL